MERGGYYGHEIDPNDPANHRLQHDKKKRLGQEVERFHKVYVPVLEKIFANKDYNPLRPIR